MCIAGKTRTVRSLRKLLKHPVKARAWNTAHRKLVFGMTKASVEKQLQTIVFCGRKVRVHKKIVPSLMRVQKRIRDGEVKNKWGKWIPSDVQSFNWRTIRGGKSLSRHAHAIALDIHPAKNAYYSMYTGKDNQTTDIPAHVFNAFLAEGWTLGVEWTSPLDVMHVQYC